MNSLASTSQEIIQQGSTSIHQPFDGTLKHRSLMLSHQIEESEKPWLQSKRIKRSKRRANIFCLTPFLLGVMGSIVFVTFEALNAYKQVGGQNYCLLFEDHFDQGQIDSTIWTHEVQAGGWGTGSFEWTTDSPNNSYVKDGKLYIVPTLTSDVYGEEGIQNGVSVNLTESGGCTATYNIDEACVAISNSTAGTILPPVQSARLTTKLSGKNIRYGKIEVTAKMPKGDWIWPAIWMMPVNDRYGSWPASGEIDIFEGKGNPSRKRQDGLSARMTSTLHWGPIPELNGYRLSSSYHDILRHFWTDSMHTFGLQWNSQRIVTYFNSRANVVLDYVFGKHPGGFWETGHFPYALSNGTLLDDPWTPANGVTNQLAAPFDQEFYLILNVAVGSTNGYFRSTDSNLQMPWSDQSLNPAKDFWTERDTWLPSWPQNDEDRAMVVDSVKVWQLC